MILKMVVDNGNVETTKPNYELLCDVKTLLSLAYVLTIQELMYGLFMFAQKQQILMYDFINALKLCEVDMCTLYCDIIVQFSVKHFGFFLQFVEHADDAI